MTQKTQLISLVIPVFNEEKGIIHFLDQLLLPELDKISKEYRTEVLLVNDGSTDQTLSILQHYLKQKPTLKLLSLSRNFGKEAALSAGLQYAKGDAVVTIDCDGQQPPHLLPEFIKHWQQGSLVVTGVRDQYTKHGLIPRLGSKLFYKLLRFIGNKHTVPGSTDFRLIDRFVVDQFNQLTERNRITRGLIDWLGFSQTYINYTYGVRYAGKPSYNFSKLFRLAIDSFISMSTTPLVIFGYLGVFITISSGFLGLFCLINQYLLGDPLQLYWNGAVQMSILITFLVGLILISQAITALYISHIHSETQNRPLFIIDHHSSRNL